MATRYQIGATRQQPDRRQDLLHPSPAIGQRCHGETGERRTEGEPRNAFAAASHPRQEQEPS